MSYIDNIGDTGPAGFAGPGHLFPLSKQFWPSNGFTIKWTAGIGFIS